MAALVLEGRALAAEDALLAPRNAVAPSVCDVLAAGPTNAVLTAAMPAMAALAPAARRVMT